MNNNFKVSTIEKEAEKIKNLQDVDLEEIENKLSFSESTDNNIHEVTAFNEWRQEALKDLENFEKNIK